MTQKIIAKYNGGNIGGKFEKTENRVGNGKNEQRSRKIKGTIPRLNKE